MAFRRFGTLIIDVGRVFSIDVINNDPYTIKVGIIGAAPLILTGESAEGLVADALEWLDKD